MTIINSSKSKTIINLLFISFLFLTLIFPSTTAASDIEVILNSLKIQQGSIIRVTLKSDTMELKAKDYQAEFAGNNFSFYKSNNLVETTIAASYWSKPGIHNLKIKKNQKRSHKRGILTLNVEEAIFAVFFNFLDKRANLLPKLLNEAGADLVIASGMGQKAISIFEKNNIDVVCGASGNAKNAVVDYLKGKLNASDNACSHNDHDHRQHGSHH